MGLHIRDEETARLVRQLAEAKRLGPDEAVKLAVTRELERAPSRETVKAIQEEIRSWGRTGLKADKAFFDELSGD